MLSKVLAKTKKTTSKILLGIRSLDKRIVLLLYVPVAALLVVSLQAKTSRQLGGNETTTFCVDDIPVLLIIALGQTAPRLFYLYILFGRLWIGYDMFPEHSIGVKKELLYSLIFIIPTVSAVIVCEWGMTHIFKSIVGINIDANIFYAYAVGIAAMVVYCFSRAVTKIDIARVKATLLAGSPILFAGYFFESVFVPSFYPMAGSIEQVLISLFNSNYRASAVRDTLGAAGYSLGSLAELILAEIALQLVLPLIEKVSMYGLQWADTLSVTPQLLEASIPSSRTVNKSDMIREYENRYAFILNRMTVAYTFEFDRYRLVVIGIVLFNIESVWVFGFAISMEYLTQLWYFAVKFREEYIRFILETTYPEQPIVGSFSFSQLIRFIEKLRAKFAAYVIRVDASYPCRILEKESWERWCQKKYTPLYSLLKQRATAADVTLCESGSQGLQALNSSVIQELASIASNEKSKEREDRHQVIEQDVEPQQVVESLLIVRFKPSFQSRKVFKIKTNHKNSSEQSSLENSIGSRITISLFFHKKKNKLTHIPRRNVVIKCFNNLISIEGLPCIDRWGNDEPLSAWHNHSSALHALRNQPWVEFVVKEAQFHNFVRSSIFVPTKILGSLGFVSLIIGLQQTEFRELPTFRNDSAVESDGTMRIAILAMVDLLQFFLLSLMHRCAKFYFEFSDRWDSTLTPAVMILSFVHSTQLLFAMAYNRFLFGSALCGTMEQFPTWLKVASGLYVVQL